MAKWTGAQSMGKIMAKETGEMPHGLPGVCSSLLQQAQ